MRQVHVRKPDHPGTLPVFARHLLNAPVWVQTRGGSMRPLLADGQLVRVLLEPKRYRAGDVALYGPPDASAMHRLYHRANGGWWIADDAATMPFHWVDGKNIRGRLVGAVPQGAPGLLFGLICRFIFSAGRRVKHLIIR